MEIVQTRVEKLIEMTLRMTEEEAAAFKGTFGRISPESRWAAATSPHDKANTIAAMIAAAIPD